MTQIENFRFGSIKEEISMAFENDKWKMNRNTTKLDKK